MQSCADGSTLRNPLRPSQLRDQLASPAVPQPAELDLAPFAARVLAAARACRSGRFGDNKVFIAHVWRALQNDATFPDNRSRLVQESTRRGQSFPTARPQPSRPGPGHESRGCRAVRTSLSQRDVSFCPNLKGHSHGDRDPGPNARPPCLRRSRLVRPPRRRVLLTAISRAIPRLRLCDRCLEARPIRCEVDSQECAGEVPANRQSCARIVRPGHRQDLFSCSANRVAGRPT